MTRTISVLQLGIGQVGGAVVAELLRVVGVV
jgi:hypothetical protein